MNNESTLFAIEEREGTGRGLYARVHIPRGTLIHTAPCLLVPKAEYDNHMKYTLLEHYLFNLKSGDKLLALGVGSMFNHRDPPSVDYRVDGERVLIEYIACRDIEVGEEMYIY
jgi:SET domain-containing protein